MKAINLQYQQILCVKTDRQGEVGPDHRWSPGCDPSSKGKAGLSNLGRPNHAVLNVHEKGVTSWHGKTRICPTPWDTVAYGVLKAEDMDRIAPQWSLRSPKVKKGESNLDGSGLQPLPSLCTTLGTCSGPLSSLWQFRQPQEKEDSGALFANSGLTANATTRSLCGSTSKARAYLKMIDVPDTHTLMWCGGGTECSTGPCVLQVPAPQATRSFPHRGSWNALKMRTWTDPQRSRSGSSMYCGYTLKCLMLCSLFILVEPHQHAILEFAADRHSNIGHAGVDLGSKVSHLTNEGPDLSTPVGLHQAMAMVKNDPCFDDWARLPYTLLTR